MLGIELMQHLDQHERFRLFAIPSIYASTYDRKNSLRKQIALPMDCYDDRNIVQIIRQRQSTMAFASSKPSILNLARSHTVAFSGIDVKDVDAQVQISAGLPAVMIVELPDKALGESRERVRSALARSVFPQSASRST